MASPNVAAGALAERYAACFRERLRPIRLIGREAEFPVVWPDGRAGDVLRLWTPLLERDGFTPQYDDPATRTLIVALRGADGTVEVEVGRATVELVLGPYEDLWQLADSSARSLRRVVAAAAAAGMLVLGFGIQPRARGSPALMTPKRRYTPLLEAIGRPWLHFAITASDQVQVDITRGELPDAINVLNLLSAPLIALTANSSVYGGHAGRYLSGREGLAAGLGEFRAGMTPRPFASIEEFIDYICRYPCYMLRDGQGFRVWNRPFDEYLRKHGPDLDAYLWHEHYTWNSARPRANNSTIEIRPVCQQPPEEALAAAALSLGFVEALTDAKAFLWDLFPADPWPPLRRYRAAATLDGLRAPEPAPAFLEGCLRIAEKGLRTRGRGEEAFLTPLWARLDRRITPAERNREAFRAGGMEALVRATAHGFES
jgi:gamma-glutamylcysteine synthetase